MSDAPFNLGELLVEKTTLDWTPTTPKDISYVLLSFLMLHIIDYLFYAFTKKKLDMWKVIKPEDKDKLVKDEEITSCIGLSRIHNAWAKYIIW